MPQHEVVACFVCYDATSHIPRRSNDDVDYRMCDRCLSLSENHNWLMETDWDGKKSSPKKFLFLDMGSNIFIFPNPFIKPTPKKSLSLSKS